MLKNIVRYEDQTVKLEKQIRKRVHTSNDLGD